MFGIYRLYLSLLVVTAHLWQPTLFKTGTQAVACFFVLSGFLMVRSVEATYGHSTSGFIRYISNRALRIYPVYWIILLASCFFLMLFPNKAFNFQMRLSADLPTIFANISLINLYNYDQIFIPPAWSLTVELFFYIIIGLVPLTLRTSFMWLAVSLPSLFIVYFWGLSENQHLVLLTLGSFSFSVGAFLHFIPKKTFQHSRIILFTSLLTLPCLWYILKYLNLPIRPLINYFGIFLGAICVYILDQSASHARTRKIALMDNRCGELAYPLFLVHYLVAEIITALNVPPYTGKFFLISLVSSTLCAFFLCQFFEKKINTFRNIIRGKLSYTEQILANQFRA